MQKFPRSERLIKVPHSERVKNCRLPCVAGQTFNPYDHGARENLNRYGSTKPVPYNLSLVTAPVHVFWGDNDALTTPEVLFHL